MSKVARFVGAVAGVVAVVATGGAALGLAGLGAIGQAAAAVAGVTSTVAQMTAKKPRAVGDVTSILIGSNLPIPYAMGRTYAGGNEIHRTAWGGTVDKVPNPYMARTIVYSISRAHAILGVQADFTNLSLSGTAASGHYSGFLWVDTQMGARPETSALAANWTGEPGWSTAHKLSGWTAAKYSLKFDKKGKVFASGQPQFGLLGEWGYVYDPRLDSSFPGGSGACRANDESTWIYSENPALHAGTYALGLHANGVKLFGIGMAATAIDWPVIADWANLCTANNWTVSGLIYEPGDKWENLKLIAEAGGGAPGFVGGMITFDYARPRTALDSITADDIAEGGFDVPAMRAFAERFNTAIPRYTSEGHKWEMVQSDAVSVAAFVSADGEEKAQEVPLRLVTQKDQAAQIAAYRMHDSREIGPPPLRLKPRMIEYRPGDALMLDLPEYLPAPTLMVVTGRTVDPASMTVTLDLRGETPGKHALALAATGTAPPDAAVISGADRDGVAATLTLPPGYDSIAIRNAQISGDPALTGTDAGSSATITVAAHAWDYPTLGTSVTWGAGSITGQAFVTTYYVYFDADDLAGGSVTYHATTDYAAAINSTDHPARHYVGVVTTPADGAGDTTGDPWGGWSGGWLP